MAIFHLSLRIAKREGGKRSLIAMAAYRSGERLYSELYDKISHYSYRTVKPETFIMKPSHVPDEFLNRENLWNKMELAEKQPNSRLCRELNLALPIELSNDDQKSLIVEYVNDNFVKDGMIADVAIHRDNEINPHVHIMLTMREVDSQGNILNKRKRIPKLDDNGNQIYNEKGQRVTVSVKTNNWDRKELVSEIRKDWANKVNSYFLERNINEQISEKSHAELGIKKLPTIHEGFYTNEMSKRGVVSNLRKKNQAIHDHNNLINKQEKLLEHKKVLSKNNNFDKKMEKSFSPLEKKELKKLSSDLKIFIDDKNVSKRLEELNRWENSLLFNSKEELSKQRVMLNKITDEREKLKEAEIILTNQSQRFIRKFYPGVNIENLSDNEIRAIVNESVLKQVKLDKDSFMKVLYDEKIVELKTMKTNFREKLFQTSLFLDKKIKETERILKSETNSERKSILEMKIQKLNGLQEGLREYVKLEVKQRFGENVEVNDCLSGELLLAKADYYQTTNFTEVEKQGHFTANEINQMLEQSRGYLSNITTQTIQNDCQGVYLIKDSMKHVNEISPLAKRNLSQLVERNTYFPNEDKKAINQMLHIEVNSDKNEPKLGNTEYQPQLFQAIKFLDGVLSSGNKQKTRDLNKLIKQTKNKEKRQRSHDIRMM